MAFLGLCLFAPLAQAEVIRDFSATYTIQADGTVVAQEVINYDFESADRHGIFRTLLKQHPQGASAWYKNRFIAIDVLSVQLNNDSVSYEIEDNRTHTSIKIGDPDTTLSGVQQYTINYTLTGALSSGPEGAEFYYNVTGDEWPVTIEQVVATVRGEQPQFLVGNNDCYVGVEDAFRRCDMNDSERSGVTFAAADIPAGQELSVAAEVDATLVTIIDTERIAYLPFGLALAALWLIGLAIWVYRHRTQDVLDKPVIAQYEPYGAYLPMYTGVLYDGRLDAQDITAGVLYLAEQGFIRITKTDEKVLYLFNTTDYEITLLKPIADIPTEFLTSLSELLFEPNAVPPQAVMLSTLAKKPAANSKIIQSLNKSLKNDLRNSAIMTNTMPKWTFGMTMFVLALTVLFGSFVLVEGGVLVLLLAGFGTFTLLMIAWTDRRTAKGYEVKNHLDGFKLFLSVTDKERFDFHNAPEKSPELFMKYLPYAVALGVEEKWAKVFDGITIPQPDWYRGGDVSTFSAVALTNDIGSFASSLSSSSGASGSSGGGAAGGGGGGGGGGSW